jgi:hypothetical protein
MIFSNNKKIQTENVLRIQLLIIDDSIEKENKVNHKCKITEIENMRHFFFVSHFVL